MSELCSLTSRWPAASGSGESGEEQGNSSTLPGTTVAQARLIDSSRRSTFDIMRISPGCYPYLQMYSLAPYLIVLSLFVLSIVSMSIKRKYVTMKVCRTRPGLTSPFAISTDSRHRFGYAAVYALLLDLVWDFLVYGQCTTIHGLHVSHYWWQGVFTLVHFLFMLIIFYPLMALMSVTSQFMAMLGFMYSMLYAFIYCRCLIACHIVQSQEVGDNPKTRLLLLLPSLVGWMFLVLTFTMKVVEAFRYTYIKHSSNLEELMLRNNECHYLRKLIYPHYRTQTIEGTPKAYHNSSNKELLIRPIMKVYRRLVAFISNAPIDYYQFTTRMCIVSLVVLLLWFKVSVIQIAVGYWLTETVLCDESLRSFLYSILNISTGDDYDRLQQFQLAFFWVFISSWVVASGVCVVCLFTWMEQSRRHVIKCIQGSYGERPSCGGYFISLTNRSRYAAKLVCYTLYTPFAIVTHVANYLLTCVHTFVLVLVACWLVVLPAGLDAHNPLSTAISRAMVLCVYAALTMVALFVGGIFTFIVNESGYYTTNRRLYHISEFMTAPINLVSSMMIYTLDLVCNHSLRLVPTAKTAYSPVFTNPGAALYWNYIRVEAMLTNPVCIAFCRLLYYSIYADEVMTEQVYAEFIRRLRVQNRWRLAYTLLKNPSIIPLRRSPHSAFHRSPSLLPNVPSHLLCSSCRGELVDENTALWAESNTTFFFHDTRGSIGGGIRDDKASRHTDSRRGSTSTSAESQHDFAAAAAAAANHMLMSQSPDNPAIVLQSFTPTVESSEMSSPVNMKGTVGINMIGVSPTPSDMTSESNDVFFNNDQSGHFKYPTTAAGNLASPHHYATLASSRSNQSNHYPQSAPVMTSSHSQSDAFNYATSAASVSSFANSANQDQLTSFDALTNPNVRKGSIHSTKSSKSRQVDQLNSSQVFTQMGEQYFRRYAPDDSSPQPASLQTEV